MAEEVRKKLLSLGIEESVVRNTIFFYFDSDVSRGFRHKEYGFQKKNVSQAFADHVQTAPALWFRNQPRPEERCFARHKTFVEEAEKDVFLQMTLPAPMAHDYPGGKTEGGAKDYLLISPWQFLNTITDTPSKNVTMTFNAYSKKILEWPEPGHPWFKGGQPVLHYPRCSMYTHRYNPNAPLDKQHAVMVLDVDGKCCMTPEQRVRKDVAAGERIKRSFETSVEGSPPRLDAIAAVIKEEMRRLNDDVRPQISWHKTVGWKPSWRGYVWGALFSDIEQAESFIAHRVLPRLEEEQADWYEDGILDKKTYAKGYDRCMGSAKMDYRNKGEMRFMQNCPLEKLSDEAMVSVFRACPNEYFLRCLGVVQDPLLSENPFISGLPAQKMKKRRRLASASSFSSIADATPIERAVSNALKNHGLCESWKGHTNTRATDHWVEIRPSPESAFCVFKQCELTDTFEPRKKRDTEEKHSMNNPGMVFRINLRPDKKDPLKRYWLTQKCWSCGNKTDKANRFERVCPVPDEVVAAVLESVREDASPQPKKKEKTTLADLCIDFEFASI